MTASVRVSCDAAFEYGTCAAHIVVPMPDSDADLVRSMAAQGWRGGRDHALCPPHQSGPRSQSPAPVPIEGVHPRARRVA